jgi:RNA polymerase sigma factor (sigma-70 family)
MTESHDLLVEYTLNGTESAFRELVVRYMDLVYSTALRKVIGDAQMAQDVAQTVFLHLAKKAPELSKNVMLGGWLHQATCNVAATFTRTERRRLAREKQAVQMNTLHNDPTGSLDRIAPMLDDAISQLPQEDRTAILLRFFEKRDFRSVGESLGSSEDAARMRVNRALEKLHLLLKLQGVTISAAALAVGLSAEAVSAAPVGLAMTVAGSALAGAAGPGTALTLLKIMTMSKLKASILGTLVVAGVATPLVISRQTQSRLFQENEALRQQLAQLSLVTAENDRLSNQVAQAQGFRALAQQQAGELLRLRGELGTLRQQEKEWNRMKAALAAERTRQPSTSGTDAKVDRVPKESWAFAGYASPEAALQSVVWAMSKGDVKTFLSSATPEAQKLMAQQYAGKTESEIAVELAKELGELAELPLGDKKIATDGSVTFRITVHETDDGATKTHDEAVMTFEKVGGEWKYSLGPRTEQLR